MRLSTFAGSILHLILFFSITKTSNCLSNLGNETDRLALLEFKTRISSDPNGILSSWNDSSDFCRWEGITCGRRHKRVISLDLPGLSLMGTLSPYISNLTFLRIINLTNNTFQGEIPERVGYLFRLKYLHLSNNTFEGQIPANISYCSNLRVIGLEGNNLAGKIPAQLDALRKLAWFVLNDNKLTGEFPHSLGNLSSLVVFSVSDNNLQGNIPNDFGQLTSLSKFSVSVNNLTGKISSFIYNLSSLTEISLSGNQFEGTFPPNIGLILPNLQKFVFGGNLIHGSIPISFANASQLELLDIPFNKLTGPVPIGLGYLKSLWWLNLRGNFLGSNTIRDLDFMTSLSNCTNLKAFYIPDNNFGGPLPSFANMSKNLNAFSIARNQIYGEIPSGIGNFVNLNSLSMAFNLISGPIPHSLGKLVKLQLLSFGVNRLSGEIPQSLSNITQLTYLYLEDNKLDGNLPSIGNFKYLLELDISANNLIGSIPEQIPNIITLIYLNFSKNALTGLIPPDVGNLKSIDAIDISKNKLSGEIPKSIGACSSLEFLIMRGNMLEGDIPSSLASLKSLQELDLSMNNLSGSITRELENLTFLYNLNLSFNNLEGEVPKEGVFSNLSAISLDGNTNLCGGIPKLQLPICPVQGNKHGLSAKAITLAAIISASIISITIVFFYYVSYQRKSRKKPSSTMFDVDKLPRISYNELSQATMGFSSNNLVGEGSFGSVYKGNLDPQGERLVAVKVLNLQQHGASKSFLAECKALRNIRHRNLVKILTYCSTIDFKGNDFKALVYDFMKNGSLETWLHPQEDGSRSSSLLERLRIAVDVSSALHYLHDNCETPIIHCDLKPSNILFDSDMTAHVGDFGLARFLWGPTNNSSQGAISSIGIKGTIGYMAPEYGLGSQATKYGDIYSFGIILLEIFTGRRPTDKVFMDGSNLHNFVREHLPTRVMQILDPVLITTGDVVAMAPIETSEVIMEDDGNDEIHEDDGIVENLRQDGGDHLHKCIVSVLKIGLACSADLPRDRMNMGDVNRKLSIITETFLRTRTQRARRIVAH